ncbi:MAG: peptide deformylase [Thermoflexus sp.]|jgi:peptide deformylase|uniref:peptide deformylase n=1 Tax=Thermoflexus TaxID=1495649 RepID=UPI001C772374|nr:MULTISPECIES: peptide deformylase [Thermoflexus]MDT7885745.1 peptide deformylase [Thermoflexus sp.]MDT7949854.1 peptide deformylase [Thermoflexus sp.]QWK11166.1 MAG: peptide deformylase [Thermoflexus hugenholtzii]
MAVRPIVMADQPILRRKAEPVTRITPALRRLIADMVETMRAAEGIGLAAPQVGEPLRVIIVEVPEDEEVPGSGVLYAVINPEIVEASPEIEEGVEGCLSIPGWYGWVPRARWVIVRGLNPEGRRVRIRAEGLVARVFQHEIDHLDGILFPDRIQDPTRIWRAQPVPEPVS